MGFSKKGYSAEVEIVVNHAWYPDSPFTFFFPKVLPQAALDAEKTYFGLTDAEGKDAARKALIEVVALMSTRAPEGFDDIDPPVDQPFVQSLKETIRNYFDDPSCPELEQIITAAWMAYKQGARPTGYLKSLPRDDARSGQPANAVVEAPAES